MRVSTWIRHLLALWLSVQAVAVSAADGAGQGNPAGFEADAREVLMVMDTWARSWSNLEPKGYISSYSPDYVGKGFPSHFAWAASRQQRLQAQKHISLVLKEVAIEADQPGRIRVTFTQHYTSDSYKDVTRKRLVFGRVDGRWYIVRETTLKKLN